MSDKTARVADRTGPINLTENAILLRRRGAVLLPDTSTTPALGIALADHLAGRVSVSTPTALLPAEYVAAVSRNFEALGYLPSAELLEGLRTLSLETLTAFHREVSELLRTAKGAHRLHKPMYPNFPAQVMEASLAELYLNAILHYWTDGAWTPSYEVVTRLPLLDPVKLVALNLGTKTDFEALFGQIAGSNASLSGSDREDLTWFVRAYGDDIERLLPTKIPQKENRAILGALLAAHTTKAQDFLAAYVTSATDVLRLAAALSGGDVSLATNTKFHLARPERRLLLSLLEAVAAAPSSERRTPLAQDLDRHAGMWKRLAHETHAGEFARRYPHAYAALTLIRADATIPTVASAVEAALARTDVAGALTALSSRPGDLARRLDHLLRADARTTDAVLAAFEAAAPKVSTPVLLGLACHFAHRSNPSPVRVFFPKGAVAKAAVIANETGELPAEVCDRASAIANEALRARFAALAPLGKVYLDPALTDCLVPAGARSASASARTITRGSRFALEPGKNTARFFIWWRNMADGGRVDLDLTSAMYDENFTSMGEVAYYNLRAGFGAHSGDIVNAPAGASEFIDVNLEKAAAAGVRYVGMIVTSYTQQPFNTIPECFAGWMMRSHVQSGEIYDPRTVIDKLDVTSPTKMTMPLLIDVLERKVIWADMTMRHNNRRANAVFANRATLAHILMAIVGARRPNLYDLMALHAQARGTLVGDRAGADIAFTLEDSFPFRAEEIASSYMGNSV